MSFNGAEITEMSYEKRVVKDKSIQNGKSDKEER